MHTALEQLRNVRAAQLVQYSELKAQLQAACPHNNVLHNPNNADPNNYWSHCKNPVRACLDCGVSETGSWWSSEHNWRPEKIVVEQLGRKEGRTITLVTVEEFAKTYLP